MIIIKTSIALKFPGLKSAPKQNHEPVICKMHSIYQHDKNKHIEIAHGSTAKSAEDNPTSASRICTRAYFIFDIHK